MMTRLGALARGAAIVLGAGSLVLGSAIVGACSSTPTDATVGSTAPSSSVSADAAANIGGKVAKAWRSAPSALASGSSQIGGEPPPQGIFAPGDADKIVKKGESKIEVFDEGSAPKVNISSYVLAGEWKVPTVIQVTSQGRSIGLPAIGVVMNVRPLAPGEEEPKDAVPEPPPSPSASAGPSSAPKAPKPHAPAAPSAKPSAGPAKPAGSASASASAAVDAPAAPPPPVVPATAQGARMLVTISDAKVEADAATVAPKEAALASGLNGSSIVFTMSNAGATAFRNVLAPGGNPILQIYLEALVEVLSSEYVPAPGKPIGANGYFMVIDRSDSLGIDVVRYRVFRVVKITGDVATVTLEVRQYAADSKLEATMLGDKNVPLGGYGGGAKGILEVAPNLAYPKGTFLQFSMQFVIGEGPPGALDFIAMMGPLPAGVQIQAGPGPGPGEDE